MSDMRSQRPHPVPVVEGGAVGIIPNPMSGRDIRRLTSPASVFPNTEKASMVLRTGRLRPTGRLEPRGVAVRLDDPRVAAHTVLAPIAAGLLESVGVLGSTELRPNVPHRVELDRGSIARDGERELDFGPGRRHHRHPCAGRHVRDRCSDRARPPREGGPPPEFPHDRPQILSLRLNLEKKEF